MKKNIVMKKMEEAKNERGRVRMDLLEPEVIMQIANAYVSGAKGMLPLYSKKDVADYYDTTVYTVSRAIDTAIEYGYIKFSTVSQIIENSADNERRHAEHTGLTKSEKRYAELLQKRFKHFKDEFESEKNRALYDAAYKMYLGQSTLKKVMGLYGFSLEEMMYLLKRKACIDMAPIEYGIFQRKFYRDFLGTPGYWGSVGFISFFREKMADKIVQLIHLRSKDMKESEEYEKIRAELVAYFKSF